MGTRQRILEAAAEVIRRKGLSGATTKEIARQADCSEGTLYNYFDSKVDLFLAVLREQMPSFLPLLAELPDRAGSGAVRDNLNEIANLALHFYVESLPMGGLPLYGEPELMARHRDAVLSRGGGPHNANQRLASYLRAEQRLGRVRGDVNPDAVAHLLLGACLYRAVLLPFLGEDQSETENAQFLTGIVESIMQLIEPPGEEEAK